MWDYLLDFFLYAPSLPSSYPWSDTSRTQLCSPDSRLAPHESDAYHRLENLLEMLCQLVAISLNYDSSCAGFLLCLDLELELPWALFLGECPPHTLSCDDSIRKSGQPRALGKVPLQLLTWHVLHALEACPTREAHVVICADNVVEVCQIILDGIRAEWATWYLWPVPILGFIRQEDWNTHKRVLCICSSCNSPNGVMGPPWNTTMIYGQRLEFCENQETSWDVP